MRTRAIFFLLAVLAACGESRGVGFTPKPDAVDDVADAADENVPTFDVPAPDASAPDASAPDARADATAPDARADVSAPDARADAASDVADDAAGDAGPAPDVGGCGAMPLGSRLGVVATGSTSGAGSMEGTCGGADAPDAVFSWTAPRAGTYRIDTGGSDFDTVLYVLDGGCTGAELDCNDDAEKSLQSELTVTLRAGQTVVIVVDGYDETESGPFSLNINEAAPDDAGAPDA